MKYLGTGFLAGIPARDLTAEEVEKFGEKFLLSTGLYEKEKLKVEEKTKVEVKDGRQSI